MLLAPTIIQLAQHGANLELTKECKLLAPTIEQIVGIVKATGAHVTIDESLLLAPTALKLAQLGGKHVTFRV